MSLLTELSENLAPSGYNDVAPTALAAALPVLRAQTKAFSFPAMSTVAEIEAAIERLPLPEVEKVAEWLETYRAQRSTGPQAEAWLARARGAARPGVTTAEVMTLTRGET